MADDILSEIIERRNLDIKSKGFDFGFEIPQKRTRRIHPFLIEKGVILEVKRASPSKGDIAINLDSYKTAKTYAKAGAKAISCLTEMNYFKGNLGDLMNVCRAADDFEKETGKNPPAVLRKDFLTCTEDIEISYRAGADAVLLIARILSSNQILEMAQKAKALGLSMLIEVRCQEDLEKLALILQNVDHNNILCGVNSRDLKDFSIDMLIPVKMYSKIKALSEDARITFESGILSAKSAGFARNLGFHAILLGEAAAKEPNLAEQFIKAFENSQENKSKQFWQQITTLQDSKTKPILKICGITNEKDALIATQNGADILGFIFWNKSSRNIDAKKVIEIKKNLKNQLQNGNISKIPLFAGVIVDTDINCLETKNAISLVESDILDAIHVHTFDSALKFCTNKEFSNIPHYCAVNLNCKEDLKKLDELAKLGEPRILLDAQSQNQIGGTGTQIDEELLSLVSKKYKLWIAGGINSENVNHLISNFHPELIDVSSSLEIEPGIKSEEKIKFFCQQFIDKKTK